MTDLQLRKLVEDELSFEPSVNAAAIGVAVKDGIATLSGYVHSYAEEHAAERAALRVQGVKGVARELTVRLSDLHERTDEDIARTAVNVLTWNTQVPHDRIKVEVANGWLTLEGNVEWQFQKDAAERGVRLLAGVKGVSNHIKVQPAVQKDVIRTQIEEALKRSAEADARRITVETKGSHVTLRGTARSWTERRDAERAAWSAPGVTQVDNFIAVTTTIPATV